jgi:hypothetical protein
MARRKGKLINDNKPIPDYAFIKDDRNNVVLPMDFFANLKGQVIGNLGANWYKATVPCRSFFDRSIIGAGKIRPLEFLSGTAADIRKWQITITHVVFGKEFESFCKVRTDRRIVPIAIAAGLRLDEGDKPSTMKEVGECFFFR